MDIGEAIHIMDVRRNDGTMLFSQCAAWDVIRPLVAPGSASANNTKGESLLCGLTGVKCANRVRNCKLEWGRCSGQRKPSPVA